MGTAGRSCVKTKQFSFSQQVEKFSWRLARGPYTSPVYYCESTECNWGLVIEAIHQPVFGLSLFDYIQVSLVRKNVKKENQSVNVQLTIEDSFKKYSFYAAKEVHFKASVNEDIILNMRKYDLFKGFCGLNKVRFIPNDILTVKCQITVYETVEENYTSEKELEDTTKYIKNDIFNWLYMLFAIVVPIMFVLFLNFQYSIPFLVLIFRIILLCVFAKILLIFLSPGGNRTFDEQKAAYNEIKEIITKIKDSILPQKLP